MVGIPARRQWASSHVSSSEKLSDMCTTSGRKSASSCAMRAAVPGEGMITVLNRAAESEMAWATGTASPSCRWKKNATSTPYWRSALTVVALYELSPSARRPPPCPNHATRSGPSGDVPHVHERRSGTPDDGSMAVILAATGIPDSLALQYQAG
jgi:hypothetical protein